MPKHRSKKPTGEKTLWVLSKGGGRGRNIEKSEVTENGQKSAETIQN